MINKIFYILKPLIPRRLQIFLRRILVKRKAKKYADVWPILLSSAKKPDNWQGWKDNKKFAFVLTHDVELIGGHEKCKQVMEIEEKLGFVSSFNFVPERYPVSAELREFISGRDFEVGVHGLNHDGKLFSSKAVFEERSKKINNYIKSWNSVGFRAPAMHHNLEWIMQLDIEYDLSTFDTDPFEPQADGVGTIFPFTVGNEINNYVEMPYTLVQDFTLFILIREKDTTIWKTKLDWIVKNEGMVLLNVHPDYMNFGCTPLDIQEFPSDYYTDFLSYVKETYKDQYWNALPKEISKFWKENYPEVKQPITA